MPIPKPSDNETQDAFIGRCMADGIMNSEYPDASQRAAICHSSWREKNLPHSRIVPFKAGPDVNEMQRLVSGMVSTTHVDMVGDVVLPEGCDTKTYFDGTRSVDLNHDPDLIVGSNVNLKVHDGKGIHTLTYVDDATQFQRDVFTMLMHGTIRGLSIEWDPSTLYASAPTPAEMDTYGMKCKRVFRKWTLTSYAFTARPCNPKALIDGIKSHRYEQEQEEIWEELRDMLDSRKIKATSAVAAGLPMRFLRRTEARTIPQPLVLSGAPESFAL